MTKQEKAAATIAALAKLIAAMKGTAVISVSFTPTKDGKA